jgi:lysylphosphatidylglycerol synthetase-like protein (DUF2156 family)
MTAARRTGTGLLLIASALLSILGYAVLAPAFGWPDVLDEPGTTALDKYVDAERTIRTGFYVMTLASLVLIPAAVGLRAAVSRDSTAARAITAFGVLAAFAQMLGWLRWVIAVPVQADAWVAARGDDTARTAVATAYDTLNAYAGGTLGEHLGWLLQGIWAVGVFVLALRATGIPRWVSGIGLALSVVWAALVPYATAVGDDTLETVGLNVYTAWYVWLLVLGVVIAVRRVGPPANEPEAAGRRPVPVP